VKQRKVLYDMKFSLRVTLLKSSYAIRILNAELKTIFQRSLPSVKSGSLSPTHTHTHARARTHTHTRTHGQGAERRLKERVALLRMLAGGWTV
jgi:hypothetical protein